MYFCYVFFLTIGYGDYVPVTPAGRGTLSDTERVLKSNQRPVIFILYSIVSVPIMASFAVQTIQGIFQKLSSDILLKREAQAGLGERTIEGQGWAPIEEAVDSQDSEKNLPRDVQERLRKNNPRRNLRRTHTDFVRAGHEWIDSCLLDSLSGEGTTNEGAVVDADDEAAERTGEREREEDRILTEYILELAVELEKHARRLLLGHMQEGSNARMLLKADRIVQLRNMKVLAAQEQTNEDESQPANFPSARASSHGSNRRSKMNTLMQKYYEEEAELLPFPADLDEQETLREVALYREAFAGLLAAGSRLLRLKDEEKFLFERRCWRGTVDNRRLE